jgi:hypothetical protein
MEKYYPYTSERARLVHSLSGLPGFWTCPSSAILKNKTFRKLDLLSSSGKTVGGTYSVGSVGKR